MSKQMPKILATAVLALLPIASQALPIDWHGSFGVDSTLISDFRGIKSKTDNSGGVANGSQEVPLDNGNKASASWQSYVFRLAPTMVINDAATFFGELSTGYANGGYLGENSEVSKKNNNAGSIYYHNQNSGSSVILRKAYLELYSDTATYQVGRHSAHWALGAIYNEGSDAWDRHETSRDGVTMKLKIGNFHVSPFWAKDSNLGYTDATSAKQYGASLLYDNQERDIAFGLLYSKKSNNPDYPTTTGITGESNISITDLYLKKVFGKFDFAVELPLMSGDLKTASSTTYSAKAILLQSNYKWTESWTLGFDFGQVSGHDGEGGKFGALYLNPNYQVANLLFRYNFLAIKDHNYSIYDSYITNARYFKLRSSYSSEKWTFDSAIIVAQAQEVARAGVRAYNHTKNTNFVAQANQDKNLGTEIDLNGKYHWNKEISIGTGLGYLITGKYFGYNDTATPNATKSSLLLQINTAVTF